MDSSGSESSLSIDDNSSSGSEKGSETDPENLVDAKSSKFNPLVALCCEDKAINLPVGSKYLHIFELEKAIPDPTKEPIKKSSIAIAAEISKAKRMSQKPMPALKPITAAYSPATGSVSKADATDIPKPGGSGTASVQNSSLSTPSTLSQNLAVKQAPSAASSTSEPEPFYPIPGRKFLAHQLPVYRPPKKHPNVLTVMEDISGPLAALREAKKSNRRIKVWTRGVAGIRGFCVASVQAFDSHWNLALYNVNEVFQRKRAYVSNATADSASICDPTTTEEHGLEKQEYRSGKYLRDVSKSRVDKEGRASKINPRIQTESCKDMYLSGTNPILIEGPDALLTCRLQFSELTLYEGRFKTGSGVKIKCVRDKSNFEKSKPNSKVAASALEKSDAISSEIRLKSSSVSKSQLRKKRLTIFQEPFKDPFGFLVVARSKNYEIVERFQKHLFLVGNEVAFIEMNPGNGT